MCLTTLQLTEVQDPMDDENTEFSKEFDIDLYLLTGFSSPGRTNEEYVGRDEHQKHDDQTENTPIWS